MKKLLSILGVSALLLSFSMTDSFAKDKDDAEDTGPSVHFVELNPLILPIIGDRGATQMVSLIVSVEVDSEEDKLMVEKYSPRLTDAFLSDLYGTFGSIAQANGGIVPIPLIKQRLNSLSAKVLGENVVDDVLLQVMQKRAT
jgi:flagellar FliL protein